MKIVFISNYYTHHQSALCQNLVKATNGNFVFIATTLVEEERVNLGWQTSSFPEFVHQLENEREFCIEQVDNADLVIYGSAPYELLKTRLKDKKFTFFYAERFYKKPVSFLWLAVQAIRNQWIYRKYNNFYCLAASAFTSYDFSKTLTFKNKCYKWGYFPEAKKYDINSILESKKPHSIVWVARFIEWKHPEACIDLAKRFLADGINDFNIEMIGTGVLIDRITKQISSEHLGEYISVLGSMTPENVRKHMEHSEIFLFTSDRNEGWGAVLNEAMNSGCAVVASSEIGSVPFLINDRENGLIYKDGNLDEMYRKVKLLLIDADQRKKIGLKAYQTINELWNAEVATERLLLLFNDIIAYGKSDRYVEGPCSIAHIVKDGWYKG